MLFLLYLYNLKLPLKSLWLISTQSTLGKNNFSSPWQAYSKRPNPLDDDVTPCWFCIDCMVLQSTKVNNNTARDIIIERIRPFCLSLWISAENSMSSLFSSCLFNGFLWLRQGEPEHFTYICAEQCRSHNYFLFDRMAVLQLDNFWEAKFHLHHRSYIYSLRT